MCRYALRPGWRRPRSGALFGAPCNAPDPCRFGRGGSALGRLIGGTICAFGSRPSETVVGSEGASHQKMSRTLRWNRAVGMHRGAVIDGRVQAVNSVRAAISGVDVVPRIGTVGLDAG